MAQSRSKYLLMLACLFLASSVALASPAAAAGEPSCGVTFIGLHGLNEGAESSTVHDVADRFAKAMASRGVPWSTVFLNHEKLSSTQFISDLSRGTFPVATARDLLDQMVKRVLQNCSSTRIVLLGYSEGAWVADVWARNATPNVAQHIVGIVLLGDPQWLQGKEQGIARRFGLSSNAFALNPYIPPTWTDRTWSHCIQGDPICGSGFEQFHSNAEQVKAATQAEKDLPQCGPHCNYVSTVTARAAEELGSVVT